MPEKQRPKISKYNLVTGADTYATQTSQNPDTSRFLQAWIPSDDGGLYREWNEPVLGSGLPTGGVKRLFQFDQVNAVNALVRFFFGIVESSPGATTYNLWQYNTITTIWSQVIAVGTLQNVPSVTKVQSSSLLHLSDGVSSFLFDGTTWLNDGFQIPRIPLSLVVFGQWLPGINFGIAIGTNYGLISDSNGNLQFASTTGTTGKTVPNWSTTVGSITHDNSVVWVNVGPPGVWQPSTVYAANTVIFNSNGTFMRVSAGGGGSSGTAEPNWNEVAPNTTADNALTWFNHGKFVYQSPVGLGSNGWVDNEWLASNFYSEGNIVVDKNGNLQQIHTGGSGTTGSTAPAWNPLVGGTTVDNSATWTNIGLLANLQTWQANAVYSKNTLIVDSNGFFQVVSTVGTSGNVQPFWQQVPNLTNTDNTVVWTCLGQASLGPPPVALIGKYYWYTNADQTIPRVHESSSSPISFSTGPLNHQLVQIFPFAEYQVTSIVGNQMNFFVPGNQFPPGPSTMPLGTWMIGLGLFSSPIQASHATNLLGIIQSVDPNGKFVVLTSAPAFTPHNQVYIADVRTTHAHIYQSESDGSKIGQLNLITPNINSGPVGGPTGQMGFSIPALQPFFDVSPFFGATNSTLLSIFRPVRNDPPIPSIIGEVHKYRIWRRRETKPNFFNYTANEEVSSGLNGDPAECTPGTDISTVSDIINEQTYPDSSNFIRAMCSHGDALYIATEKQAVPLYGQSIDDFGISQVTAFSLGCAGQFAMISTAHGLALISYDKKIFIYPTSNYYWAYVPNDVNVTDNLIEIGKPLRKRLETMDPNRPETIQLTFYFYGRRNWLVLTFLNTNTNNYETWVYDFTNKGWFQFAHGYSTTAVWEISTGNKILVAGSPVSGTVVLDDLTGTFTSSGNQPVAIWRPALIDFGDPDMKHIPLYVEFEVSNVLMANDIKINYYLDPVDADNPGTPRSIVFQKVSGSNLFRGFFQGGNVCQRLLIEFQAIASPVSTNSGYIRGVKLVANPASGLLQ